MPIVERIPCKSKITDVYVRRWYHNLCEGYVEKDDDKSVYYLLHVWLLWRTIEIRLGKGIYERSNSHLWPWHMWCYKQTWGEGKTLAGIGFHGWTVCMFHLDLWLRR